MGLFKDSCSDHVMINQVKTVMWSMKHVTFCYSSSRFLSCMTWINLLDASLIWLVSLCRFTKDWTSSPIRLQRRSKPSVAITWSALWIHWLVDTQWWTSGTRPCLSYPFWYAQPFKIKFQTPPDWIKLFKAFVNAHATLMNCESHDWFIFKKIKHSLTRLWSKACSHQG